MDQEKINKFISGDCCSVCGVKFQEKEQVLELKVVEEYFYKSPWGLREKAIYLHRHCAEKIEGEKQ